METLREIERVQEKERERKSARERERRKRKKAACKLKRQPGAQQAATGERNKK